METPPTSSRHWRPYLSNLGLLLIAPLLAILLTTFVFQSYQVSGESMQNTLQNNDRLIVWKGSRTWARLFGGQYVPNRGDIVIVNEQNLTACNQTGKVIIKRIIGLPGERIVYAHSVYAVYNHDHPEGFNPDTSLPYGSSHKANGPLLEDANAFDTDTTLKSNQVFVSGDHRANSCDSRYFGAVDTHDIIGKVVMRIFPLSQAEKF